MPLHQIDSVIKFIKLRIFVKEVILLCSVAVIAVLDGVAILYGDQIERLENSLNMWLLQ